MGQSKKRSHSGSSINKNEKIKSSTKIDKEMTKRTLQLLNQCLKSNTKNPELESKIVKEVEFIISGSETSIVSEEVIPKKQSKSSSQDKHNEQCEICDQGGDLLCCDTCTLVFHVACVRPKIHTVPKGKWSCAYCIVDGLASGEYESAKRGIRSMRDLSRTINAQSSPIDSNRGFKNDLTILRSGRQFITRKLIHGQIVELERYSSLSKALYEIKQACDPKPANNLNEEGELWCNFCLDDTSIPLCAFCGCKSCFGKHDSENLLLCDSCDFEWHTYCLDPPLYEIPDGYWFCKTCIKEGKDESFKAELDEDLLDNKGSTSNENSFYYNDEDLDFSDDPFDMNDDELIVFPQKAKKTGTGSHKSNTHAHFPGSSQNPPALRRPGRPKGSIGKKRAEILHSIYGNNPKSYQVDIKPKKVNPGPKIIKWEEKTNPSAADPEKVVNVINTEAVGVESACSIATRAGKRALHPSELANLEVFRAWAPMVDLEQALEAFKTQKALLAKRLSDSENKQSTLKGSEIEKLDTQNDNNKGLDNSDISLDGQINHTGLLNSEASESNQNSNNMLSTSLVSNTDGDNYCKEQNPVI